MALSKHVNYRKYAKLFFFTVSVSVAVALTACGKGFKLKDLSKTPPGGAGSANISVPVTTLTHEPLLEMAATASPEIAAIASTGKASVTASKLQIIITLDSQGLSIPNLSVLTIAITVKGADGKEATAMVVSNKAAIALTAPSDVEIGGYWTIERPGKTYPFYVGLNSKVVLKGNGIAHLAGSLIANFTGDNLQTLTSFDEDICTIVADPWNWAPQYFEENSFYGCVSGPQTSPQPAAPAVSTPDDYGPYL